MDTAEASVPSRDSPRTGLSRSAIKKYLRADAAEPRYAKRVGPSKPDPFAEKLVGWLMTEAAPRASCGAGPSSADLAALGYDGSYNRVAAFARTWLAKQQMSPRSLGDPSAWLRGGHD